MTQKNENIEKVITKENENAEEVITQENENREKVIVNLHYIMPNQTVAYPIYSLKGEKLLNKHEVLTAQIIKMIIEKYGSQVYHFLSDDASTSEFSSLYNSFVNKTRESFENILWTGIVTTEDYKKNDEVVAGLIRDLDNREISVLDLLKRVGNFEDYIFYQSVNVCILSALVLKWKKKYSEENIKNVALGALFSDLGMLRVDNKIFDKPDKLSNDEFLKVRLHPQIGYNTLKIIKDVNPTVLQTILFHHEQFDNEGYYGIPYATLPISPKIVSICSTYSALTSLRPYRQPYSPSIAMKLIINSINNKFDYEIVSDFINGIGLALNNSQLFYKIGDFCILNTHEICLIKEIPIDDVMKPKVIVFARYDYSGKNVSAKFYDNPIDMDLTKDPNRRLNSLIIRQELVDALRNKLIDRKMLNDY
ncbi:MAG: hypothetical protein FWG49_07655, partial [Leptospirales bacterium]|nr:hypothetical protein [Leptospirales bacterium]